VDRDESAFSDLVRRYSRLVLTVCRQVLHHEQDAEDAYQATFLVLAKKAGSILKAESLASWLHGVAYRTAMKAKTTAAKRRVPMNQKKPMPAPDPASDAALRELQAMLHEEVNRLPAKFRAPFVLCCLEGKSQAEAAQQLGWKGGTLGGRLAQARERLRQRLAHRGVALSAVLGAAALSASTASASVSAALADKTIDAALLFVAGKVGGTTSAPALALAQGVMKAMTLSNMKVGVMLVLSVTLLATGVGLAAYQGLSATGRFIAGNPLGEGPVLKGEDTGDAHGKANPPVAVDDSKARIEGVVVDERGTPVKDAVIRNPRINKEHKGGSTRSDAEGKFRLVIDQPAVRYEIVHASTDDGKRQGLYRFDEEATLGPVARIRVVITPSQVMTVRVADADGKPVASATTVVFDQYTPLAHAETDARGRAVFRLPADAQVWCVVGLKPGVGFDYFENYRAWPPDKGSSPPAEVPLVLEGAQVVRVQATDSAGKPLSRIAFSPWTIHKNGKIGYANVPGAGWLKSFGMQTDQQGVAAFDWIPKDLKEGVTFLQLSQDYHVPNAPYFDPSQPNHLLTAKLFRNSLVGGKVTLPDGKPAAGILIQAEGRGNTSHYCRTLARTASDGSYSLRLYPDQSYILSITDEPWSAPSYTGIVVREGQARKDLDFRLDKGTLIEGEVTVGKVPKPTAGQTVTLIQKGKAIARELGGDSASQEELVRWSTTDKKGHYQIRVCPGDYQIWGPGTPHENLTVHAEKRIEMNFEVARLPRGRLTGTVLPVDGGKKPVAKALVKGESIGNLGHAGFETIADATGCFEAERWRDQMCIYASSPDGTLAGFMTIGEDDQDVKIRISPAAIAKGRLLDKDGKPLAGVALRCGIAVGPQPNPELRTILDMKTDKDGRFSVGGLVLGSQCSLFLAQGGTQLPKFQAEKAKTIDLGDIFYERPASK
jgi:RNA polymerase sigma factor (sigma-70 family)